MNSTNNNNQFGYIHILCLIGSILIGSLFIYSAYTKLFPVELFELTFVETGLGNWTLAPVEARLFIGIEFFLGLLLIFNINFSKRTYLFVFFFLFILSLYLLIEIWAYGNRGNCGCFGTAIKMTPLEGIIKNIFLMALVSTLFFFNKSKKLNNQLYLPGILLIASFSFPFIANPVAFDISSQFNEEATGYKLHLDILYNSTENPKPDIELRKGKWILSYLSLSCGHCRLVASKLQIMKKNNPVLPVYFILNGKEDLLQDFFNETKSEKIPHSRFKGEEFLKMSGPQLPAIFLIKDGIVYKKLNYFTLNQNEIENWLQKK